MNANLISIVAAQAGGFIKNKKPSEIIPFIGKFPIIKNYEREDYHEVIFKTMYVNECPQWIQDALVTGQRMYSIEKSFKDYLELNGISIKDFLEKSNSDKSSELIRFLNANSLTLDSIKIN